MEAFDESSTATGLTSGLTIILEVKLLVEVSIDTAVLRGATLTRDCGLEESRTGITPPTESDEEHGVIGMPLGRILRTTGMPLGA